jgi:hypothetical protein
MIAHLRERVAQALSSVERVTFATCGPAGPQVSAVVCRSLGTTLYLLVQRASDHLFNLELVDEVMILTPKWELRGRARPLTHPPTAIAVAQNASELADHSWEVWIEVISVRLQFLTDDGQSTLETIDL